MTLRAAILLTFSALGLYAQSNCKVGEIPMAGTVDGTFTADDCQAVRFLGSISDPGRAQGWVLTSAVKNAVYRFRLSSNLPVIRLYVLDLSNNVIGRSQVTTVDQEAQIDVQLGAGPYLLVAVTGVNPPGTYKLTTQWRAPKNCPATTLEPGADVSGTLSADACGTNEFLTGVPSASPVDPYTFTVQKPLVARVTATGTGITPALTLVTRTGSYRTLKSNQPISLAPGTYRLLAGTSDGKTGQYQIRLDTEDRRPCPLTSIAPGKIVSGKLESSACRILDLVSMETDTSAATQHQFEITSPVVASVSLKSAEVDTEVYVLDSTGHIIAYNDDADATTTDSVATTSLAPGKYTVYATSYGGTDGAYDLTIGTQGSRQCSPTELPLPGNATVTLSSTDCRYLDAVQPSTTTGPAAVLTLNVPTTSYVTLSAGGTNFPVGIQLRSGNGELLSSTSRTAQIGQLVPAGQYKVIVSSTTGSGSVNVTADLREPAACSATTLVPNGTPVNGTLTSGACPLGDLLPISGAGSLPADLYTLDVENAGRLRIAVDSRVFLPTIFVVSPDGRPAGAGYLDSDVDVQPGRYQVLVLSGSGTYGDYSITATPVQAAP